WGSTASWAAANFVQGDSPQVDFAPPLSSPLDCDQTCPGTAYEDQWRFYQHLSELFGVGIVAQILAADAALTRADRTSGHMVPANPTPPCVNDLVTAHVDSPAGGIFAGAVLGVHTLANPSPDIDAHFSSCDGGTLKLVLTNGSLTDGLSFAVSGQLTVNAPVA